jgi:hypothetical protein
MSERDSNKATASLISDPKQKATPRLTQRKTLWEKYYDSWWPEMGGVALSVACVIAMSITLKCFDNKPAPSMNFGLTLNAVISILATTSKVR